MLRHTCNYNFTITQLNNHNLINNPPPDRIIAGGGIFRQTRSTESQVVLLHPSSLTVNLLKQSPIVQINTQAFKNLKGIITLLHKFLHARPWGQINSWVSNKRRKREGLLLGKEGDRQPQLGRRLRQDVGQIDVGG